MGYWIFGSWWCDVHSAADVLLCTASIMNLCLISLDRYWSITKAVEYLKTRTPCRAAVMITAVWIMSGLICIPPLLGWKVDRPDGPLPQCKVSQNHNKLFFYISTTFHWRLYLYPCAVDSKIDYFKNNEMKEMLHVSLFEFCMFILASFFFFHSTYFFFLYIWDRVCVCTFMEWYHYCDFHFKVQ